MGGGTEKFPKLISVSLSAECGCLLLLCKTTLCSQWLHMTGVMCPHTLLWKSIITPYHS